MIRRLISRVGILLRRDRFRQELDEEIRFHLERLTQDLVRQGMEPSEARREASLRFGSQERVQARSREARGLDLFDEVGRNLRFSLRGMARNSLFAGTFILTLGLCIGLGTAVFSVVDAILLRPLPYPHPERLAHADVYDPGIGWRAGGTSVDGITWERIRDQATFVERAVYSGWARGVNLSTASSAAYVTQQRVGAGYFNTLGIQPLMGREFQESEDIPGGPSVAILSYNLWRQTFHEDPEIIGRTIRLKGEAHIVVGIMPPEFRSEAQADLWTPLRASTTGEGGGTNYEVMIRVPDGMSFEEARARMAGIELPEALAESNSDLRFGLVPLESVLTAGLRLPMLVLVGAIVLMLVVGCSNLAGLQIARSLARQSEIATRQALGSGTGALARQMIVENVMLGILGGLLGLGIAYFAVDGLNVLVQSHFGTWQDVRLDGRTLAGAAGLTVVATILFGLAPVLHVRKAEIQRVLVTGSRGMVSGGGSAIRKVLIVGEVAVVTALLFAAGLLVRSYGHLEGLDPGFDPARVLTVQFSLDDARYAEGSSVHALFRESLDQIRQIPGVQSAAVALSLPYERPLNLPFFLPGDDRERPRVSSVVYVTPGFFETMGIPVLRGRDFNESDGAEGAIVAVANQAFVDEYFPEDDALGTPVSLGFGGDEGVQIVGVVGNVQQSAGWGSATMPVSEAPTLYLATAQATGAFFSIVHVWFSPSWIIRGSPGQADLGSRVTQVFQQVDPDLPVARTASLEEVMAGAFARERFEASFLVIVAAFALLLAGVGLYGIVAHEVQERRGEMGLRMALGATPGQAVWRTGLSGVRLTLVGLALGGGLAFLMARVMGHLIYGITPFDPVTMLLLMGVLLAFTGVASFMPASRIGRMAPATILRDNS